MKRVTLGKCILSLSLCCIVGFQAHDLQASNALGGIDLPFEEFIRSAIKNDPVFEEILVDRLSLLYQKDLRLPPGDIVIGVRSEYELSLPGQDDDQVHTLSLDKLFPKIGTESSLSYSASSRSGSRAADSQISFLISQPIAENAFGRGTRLNEKIIGIEIELSRFQIVEAYEDYLAALITLYYSWYSAHENLKIGEASYRENLKLLDNIYRRKEQKIALQVDVNKGKLLSIRKEESVIALREDYRTLTNLIEKAVRHEEDTPLSPLDPERYLALEVDFERDYANFTAQSRTYSMLARLEQQRTLEVKTSADDLLPSTNLMLGYTASGNDWDIADRKEMLTAGISIDWPFTDQRGRARHKLAKIKHRKTALSNRNKYLELATNLENLYLSIEREENLLRLAGDKISLSEEILEDEAENYSFGKVTLNDYIDAVNRVDENRFNRISHAVNLKKLLVEWLRLTDRLVVKQLDDLATD